MFILYLKFTQACVKSHKPVTRCVPAESMFVPNIQSMCVQPEDKIR